MNLTRTFGAGLITAIAVLPDYVPNKWLRRVIIAALVAAGVYYINNDEDPENDITFDSLELDGTEDGPVVTWLKIGGGLGAIFAATKLNLQLGALLRKIGLRRPHTLMAMVFWAFALFGYTPKK
ncbi:hypothetical protein [Corynebacterium freiburgense]|uniref:hypothetical protein n=1 Tax=Corynebacterium freiburgense TaxID=556548 RepID=UPI00047BA0C3|nr:hypothetical protein [Corynebacterium freiburgense]WJZ01393.1 hypothetical protein CFREI_00380 [Corynebacterium freiburgense]